jgi:hypothetical protein
VNDITSHAIRTIMGRAPIWATHLAGRTRVFVDPDCPTAYVTGGGGRFKIVVNDKIANSPDLEFILLHEIAHIFRADLSSMEKYPELAPQINVAADCIINDSLVDLGVPKPKELEHQICWGKDIYKKDCSKSSINELLKFSTKEKDQQKATKPGDVDENGHKVGEDGTEMEGEPSVGTDADMSGKIGLGGSPAHYEQAKQLARSLAAYARRMFFEQGFKSKNMSSKNDWRRNRSSFAGRSDVVIPRTTYGAAGNERQGPLVNLVLDVSGSMNETWVKTAATIAEEISNAGLDFDLWLTPIRQRARNPKRALRKLSESGGTYNSGLDKEDLYPQSFPTVRHHRDLKSGPLPGAPSNARGEANQGTGADELFAVGFMETLDPVVWIYIGDYQSTIGFDLHFAHNFLHVPICDPRYQESSITVLDNKRLPRWKYIP